MKGQGSGVMDAARRVYPNEFEPERHYYQRTLGAQIHPTVATLFALSTERIVRRYCHMKPRVRPEMLRGILSYRPRFFHWSGADLFHVATEAGVRKMVVLETNSCPSGQKSMPLLSDTAEDGGYQTLIKGTFLPLANNKRLPKGSLAVVFDKNAMENTGYAATIAEHSGETVYLVEYHAESPDAPVRFVDGIMEVRDEDGHWQPIRAAFRYITQKPWNRVPLVTRTLIFNPIIACLAGGRNKTLAAKAYELYNASLSGSGLHIQTPQTIWGVSHGEIPLWIQQFGGMGVVKIPYSNAGQGVYTITNDRELAAFMGSTQHYQQFIVQSLIGNFGWSSQSQAGRLYHVGTLPNKKAQIHVADFRVMIASGPEGFRPIAMYSRRARMPLADTLVDGSDSWEMLGTNLSVKNADGSWASDTQRLMLMDRRGFDILGIGLDEIIEGFVQTVLTTIAIDQMAINLTTQKGRFRFKLFRSMNNDQTLYDEILGGAKVAP